MISIIKGSSLEKETYMKLNEYNTAWQGLGKSNVWDEVGAQRKEWLIARVSQKRQLKA